MSKVYLHPVSERYITTLVLNPPQSLLISGAVGIGLSVTAQYLADQLGVVAQIVLPEKDEKVDTEKGTISVDVIRRLYEMTKTIETSRRLIVIDYTERMGVQAQNAFLKLLEEPGKNTHFILLSHEPSKLLPTILSRVQHVEIRPVTHEQSLALLNELKVTDPQKMSQLLFMADGLPAELNRLVSDDTYFADRSQIIRDARLFLQGTPYERLTLAQNYKDKRPQSLLLLSDAMKLIQRNILEGKSDLIPTIDQLLKAYERIQANGNVRLQMAAAMV